MFKLMKLDYQMDTSYSSYTYPKAIYQDTKIYISGEYKGSWGNGGNYPLP